MYMFPSWLDNDANVGWAVHHYWSVVNHVNIILTPWNTCKERLTWVGFHNHALNLSVSPTNGWFKFNDSLCCSYKYNWCKCTCTGKIYILLIIFLIILPEICILLHQLFGLNWCAISLYPVVIVKQNIGQCPYTST